jgi:hypothetical protein
MLEFFDRDILWRQRGSADDDKRNREMRRKGAVEGRQKVGGIRVVTCDDRELSLSPFPGLKGCHRNSNTGKEHFKETTMHRKVTKIVFLNFAKSQVTDTPGQGSETHPDFHSQPDS